MLALGDLLREPLRLEDTKQGMVLGPGQGGWIVLYREGYVPPPRQWRLMNEVPYRIGFDLILANPNR